MDGSLTLLAALIALLAGLAIGKAWERYKLKDGRWVDRRRGRESPHYILGLNFLVANQIDPAIDELTKAAELAGDPLEIRLILGNLYREKGQVGRAIQEHQSLLQRPSIRKLEHANVLLCLGLDYKSGGFVDRALSAFTDVLKLDPDNRYALSNLEKIYEEQHQWDDAYKTRQRLAALDGPEQQAPHLAILGFLENERGTQALKRMDYPESARRFEAAIELDATNTPAQLNLGDVHFYLGDVPAAIQTWERLIERSPERAYLTFSRLEGAYPHVGDTQRFPELCRSLIAGIPAGLARPARARPPPRRPGTAARGARSAVRCAGAESSCPVAAPGDLGDAVAARSCRRRSSTSTSISRAAPSSTPTRTSASAAAIAAPSCCGSARTATSGTPSSKNGSRPPRTRATSKA